MDVSAGFYPPVQVSSLSDLSHSIAMTLTAILSHLGVPEFRETGSGECSSRLLAVLCVEMNMSSRISQTLRRRFSPLPWDSSERLDDNVLVP